MRLIYSPRCLDYATVGHPESPDRIRRTVARLQLARHDWLTPAPCDAADLRRVHSPDLLAALQTGNYSDADTPHFPQIYELARLSAGAAILASQNPPAFSLMRPPGHHATRDRSMGFCYVNNLAVAVARLLAATTVRRVAILDFDCHHGNGTEDIFQGDDRVRYVSLHQAPGYPGTGWESRGNCRNYPLPPGTAPVAYLAALDDALAGLRGFAPEVLAVSAGFDSFKADPITNMNLEIETFYEIGRRIAGLRWPVFAVLEGGYAPQLAQCVEAFVRAW